MRHYVLLAAASLALASCATQKALPQYTEAEKAAQRGDISYWQPTPAPADTAGHTKPPLNLLLPPVAAPDSLRFIEVSRKPNFLDKLFKHTPKTTIYVGSGPIKTGKKSSVIINNVGHSQSNTSSTTGKKGTSATGEGATATAIDKVKAPTAVGDSASAADNTKAGQRGGAAATGKNAKAEATTVKPKFPWAAVIGGVVGFGFLIWMFFIGGHGGMFLAPLVRKKDNSL
jgi:hypothetical protein